ncbi:MAG: AraC family transcriptional regulator [Tissierellia bacterium]|nr:AraC family transcriptional regulator [Tissierellia bacterium]
MDSKGHNNYWSALYTKDNYYKHFILNSKNGDIFHLKGNGYSVTGDTLLYIVAKGIHLFKTNAIYRDIDLKGTDSYPDDTLMIHKVTKGNILLAMEDGRERRLNTGDILNAASNFKMSRYHSFNKEVELVGVTFYYKYIMDAIKNQALNQSFLEEFYNNKLLHDVFIHQGNHKINKLFDEIENAINNDNRILMKAKSLELLSESALFYKDFIGLGYENLSEKKKRLFDNIKEFLDNNLDQYYSMEYIGDKFSISVSGLKKLFNEACGISPYIYHLNRRLEKAAKLLEESDYKINYIYKSVGFNFHSNFSNAFQKKYKCTPSQYRERENKI